MKKDITKIFGKRSHQEVLMKQFESLLEKANGNKEKIRELELRLLRPQPIPTYTGPKVSMTDFKKRCLTLTFPNPSYIKTWNKYFKVNFYLENNTYDIDFLFELFHLMDTGRIKWNPKNKKFEVKSKSGKTFKL